MAPYTHSDAQHPIDEVMPEDASCTCGAGAPYSCALLLILFMLIFYALALWDRYLKLKTREAMRLYTKGDLIRAYGSVTPSAPSSPRLPCKSPSLDSTSSVKIVVTPAPDSSAITPPVSQT